MFPFKTAVLSGGAGLVNTYSLEFDGSNDYLNCGNGSGVTFADGDFTVSAWIYRTSSGHTAIFGYGDDASSEENWRFRVKNTNPDTLEFLADDGSTSVTVLGSATITDNEWHHVAFSWDRDSATGAQFYLDGAPDGSGQDMRTVGDLDHSSDGFLIGVRPSSSNPTGNPWSGNIDEVAIWNTALSAACITNIYNNGVPTDLLADSNSANLQGWWRMGDGTLDSHPLIADQVNPTLGAELWDEDARTGTVVDNWSISGSNTVAVDSNTIKITYVDDGDGANIALSNSKDLSTDLTIGQVYKLSLDAKINTGTATIYISGPNITTNTISGSTFSRYHSYFSATSATSNLLMITNMGSSEIVHLDNLSIKEVNGNAGIMTNMDADDIVKDTP